MLLRTTALAPNAGLTVAKAQSAKVAAIDASPGLVHWLDPDPAYVPDISSGIVGWNARRGGSRWTGKHSASGGITRSTAINSKPTLTVNGSGIMFPFPGGFMHIPADEFTVVAVVNVDDNSTRFLFGAVDDIGASSDMPLLIGFSNNLLRCWDQSFANRAYSSASGHVGANTICMWTFSTALGIGMWENGTALTVTQGTSFNTALVDTRVQLFRNEVPGTALSRYSGDVGDILVFDRDYSAPAYDAAREALFAALGTEYNITIA